MQSQRDQVQAHQFVMRRLTSGILRADPDLPDTPTGRTLRGALAGAALAALIAAAVAVYGLLAPAHAAGWAKDGTFVIADDTGARYLYLGGALHPVPNETSAKLLAGTRMTVVTVDSSALSAAPLGAPVGLAGAPDGLPAPAGLSSGPWLACEVPRGGGSPLLTLALLGDSPAGTTLTADQGLLVSGPDGSVYVLWRGERLRVDAADGAAAALGYADATPAAVTTAFLSTLPAGPGLAAPAIAARGESGPVLAGAATRIGQLFTGPAGQHYVLTRSGLMTLTATRYALLLGDPRTQSLAYGGRVPAPAAIGAQDLAEHLAAPTPGDPADALPVDPPALVTVDPGGAVCAEVRVAGQTPAYAVVVTPAATVSGRPPSVVPGDSPGCGADRVLVPIGGGALARALTAGGAAGPELLVADDGVKYPLTPSGADALGYTSSPAVRVPAGVLDLLPTGPTLDPRAPGAGDVARPAASDAAHC